MRLLANRFFLFLLFILLPSTSYAVDCSTAHVLSYSDVLYRTLPPGTTLVKTPDGQVYSSWSFTAASMPGCAAGYPSTLTSYQDRWSAYSWDTGSCSGSNHHFGAFAYFTVGNLADCTCPDNPVDTTPFWGTDPVSGSGTVCLQNSKGADNCVSQHVVDNSLCCEAGSPGAPAGVCDPEHCSNGQYDAQTEDGLDCGKECSSACVQKCPTGSDSYPDVDGVPVCQPLINGDNLLCIALQPPNATGGCPQGYYKGTSSCPEIGALSNFCIMSVPPVKAKDGTSQSGIDSASAFDPSKDPWNSQSSDTSTTSDSTSDTNPDGSTTATTTNTKNKTNADGSKESTTETTTCTTQPDGTKHCSTVTSTNKTDKDGNGSSTDTTKECDYDANGNELACTENSQEKGGGVGDGTTFKADDAIDWDKNLGGLGDRLSARFDELQENVKGSGVFAGLTELSSSASGIGGGSSSIAIDLGSFGQTSIDLRTMDEALAVWRVLLMCVMGIAALRIIFLKHD